KLGTPVINVLINKLIFSSYLKGKQYQGKESAKGKVAIVTGANCGIGKQIVRELSQRGAKVYMGCRNLEAGQTALAELAKVGCCSTRLVLLQLDLCSFSSIKSFCDEVAAAESKVDILVNNAGVMFYPKFKITEDGHELTWQTNYLGHFLLTASLLPLLEAAADEARVLNVSARAHYYAGPINLEKVDQRSGWDRLEAYKSSKLAQVRFLNIFKN
ncbi:unnamed protein product, partial [Soboliphyme baturini]|uniref:Dehydrogenase with different specificities related to short-chain alcohol dehydrogenase n=1 Tax=Soboliphyme baturini TaxID=241478 RepID=A0A183IKM5_9BILA